MEALVVLAAMVAVLYVVARVIAAAWRGFVRATGQNPARPPAQTADMPMPHRFDARASTAQPPAPPSGVAARRLADPGACWLAAEHHTSVAGYTIEGGLLYVGEGLPSIVGGQPEPALIDPRLRVDRANPNRSGLGVPYWPSYSTISPGDRAGYLQWLAAGRRDPDAYIGYAFLFFYGLERRFLFDMRAVSGGGTDGEAIEKEVTRLLDLYGTRSGSFHGYAGRFLDLVRIARSSAPIHEQSPPSPTYVGETSLLMRVGLGQLSAAARPLPADWALGWVRTSTYLRTPATRCADEFETLFRLRYRERFGDGLVLKPNRTKLEVAYQPASASFGGPVTARIEDLPDVTAQTAPLAKLQDLATVCSAELEPYSRWLGRNAGARPGIAALALLPLELASHHETDAVVSLCRWLDARLTGQSSADVTVSDLSALGGTADDMGKADAVMLSQALERRGYGIEPDVRFGGPVPQLADHVVVFRLPPGGAATPSPAYTGATAALYFAVAAAGADSAIAEEEQRQIAAHVETATRLNESERARLGAHLRWLLVTAPRLTGLKKRVTTLDVGARRDVGRFVVSVAAADGQVTPAEVKAITRIYAALGIEETEAFRDIHSLGQEPAEEPVVIGSPGSAAREFSIPRPTPRGVALDMERVANKLRETAAVSALLTEVFADSDPAVPAHSTVPEPGVSGLDAIHTRLLQALAARPVWPREEIERISADLGLLPDGALERINEAAFERCGTAVCEGEDPVDVNTGVLEEMLR